MAVEFKKMCDRCYRMIGDNEQMFAFKLVDDADEERVFKGHKECLDEMVEIMTQLYGAKEQNEDDQR
jgi:hypothetical protein